MRATISVTPSDIIRGCLKRGSLLFS